MCAILGCRLALIGGAWGGGGGGNRRCLGGGGGIIQPAFLDFPKPLALYEFLIYCN